MMVIWSQEYTVFNAPSHTYLPYLLQQARLRGLACTIMTLKLGTFRSRYHITLRGDHESFEKLGSLRLPGQIDASQSNKK